MQLNHGAREEAHNTLSEAGPSTLLACTVFAAPLLGSRYLLSPFSSSSSTKSALPRLAKEWNCAYCLFGAPQSLLQSCRFTSRIVTVVGLDQKSDTSLKSSSSRLC